MPTVRRTLALAALLVAAGSLAFATGAAVVGPADTVADGNLTIQPADGPNGDYAYLDDDGEIAIDVSGSNPNLDGFAGVNVDATTGIGNVFTITYTGDETARVWIAAPNESVDFVAGGDSIEGESNSVTLTPDDDTVTVGLDIDTRGATPGERLGGSEFSIEAEVGTPDSGGGTQASADDGGSAPTMTVTAPGSSQREFVASDVGAGETVRFEADGMELDRADVTLDGVDLMRVETERIEVNAAGRPEPFEDAGALAAPTDPRPVAYLSLKHSFTTDDVETMRLRFSASRAALDAAGIDPADLTVYRRTDAGGWEERETDVLDAGTAEARGLDPSRVYFHATTDDFSTFAVAERVPRVGVVDAGVDTPAIDRGGEARVTATVRNGGGTAGERTVTLAADGEPVAEETVTLAPGGTATVTFAAGFDRAGEYDLTVGGTAVGTVVVNGPEGDAAGTTPQPGGSGGAGAVADDGAGENEEGGTGSDGPDGGDARVEEPGGFDPVELVGVAAVALLGLAGLAVRRSRE